MFPAVCELSLRRRRNDLCEANINYAAKNGQRLTEMRLCGDEIGCVEVQKELYIAEVEQFGYVLRHMHRRPLSPIPITRFARLKRPAIQPVSRLITLAIGVTPSAATRT